MSPARSEPASGSENSWHQISSPLRILGSQRACCSGVPWAINVGPTRPTPTMNGYRSGVSNWASSWATMAACSAVAAMPPCSTGQVGTA